MGTLFRLSFRLFLRVFSSTFFAVIYTPTNLRTSGWFSVSIYCILRCNFSSKSQTSAAITGIVAKKNNSVLRLISETKISSTTTKVQQQKKTNNIFFFIEIKIFKERRRSEYKTSWDFIAKF